MFATKLILAVVLLVGVSARHVPRDEKPYRFDEDKIYPEPLEQDVEYKDAEDSGSSRVRRVAQDSNKPYRFDEEKIYPDPQEKDVEYKHSEDSANSRVRREAQDSNKPYRFDEEKIYPDPQDHDVEYKNSEDSGNSRVRREAQDSNKPYRFDEEKIYPDPQDHDVEYKHSEDSANSRVRREAQDSNKPYRFDEEKIYPDPQDHDVEYKKSENSGNSRVRRQAHGSQTFNGDGTSGLGLKAPLVGNDRNVLSAIGSANYDNRNNLASKGFGLAFDNVNGNGLTLMKETVPGFGSKITGAGHATLFNNDRHNVGANAFATRNIPSNFPGVPNFNTVGGGVDYTFNNKVGASVGMARTPFLGRTDYSAMGNLNVFRSPTSTLDFNAGFKRFDTPQFNSGWKPNFGLSFGRSF